MSSAAQISEIDGFQDEALAPRRTRGVYVGFASLVTIGLALAGWYVGERILVAQAPHTGPEPLAPAAAYPTPAPASPSTGASSSPLTAQALQPALLPLMAEYYLQVTALGTPQDLKFLQQLQSRGLKAHLETTPTDQTGLILIGPYDGEPALRRARARLAASGILANEIIR